MPMSPSWRMWAFASTDGEWDIMTLRDLRVLGVRYEVQHGGDKGLPAQRIRAHRISCYVPLRAQPQAL